MTEGPQKALFLLVLQRLNHPPLFHDIAIAFNSQGSATPRYHSRYGLVGLYKYEAVYFVILSSTGWAHTQNAPHTHSRYTDSVNEKQHWLKASLIRIWLELYPEWSLLSFYHIMCMTKEVQLMISQASTIDQCYQPYRKLPSHWRRLWV